MAPGSGTHAGLSSLETDVSAICSNGTPMYPPYRGWSPPVSVLIPHLHRTVSDGVLASDSASFPNASCASCLLSSSAQEPHRQLRVSTAAAVPTPNGASNSHPPVSTSPLSNTRPFLQCHHILAVCGAKSITTVPMPKGQPRSATTPLCRNHGHRHHSKVKFLRDF